MFGFVLGACVALVIIALTIAGLASGIYSMFASEEGLLERLAKKRAQRVADSTVYRYGQAHGYENVTVTMRNEIYAQEYQREYDRVMSINA